jgi:hypothetical protein
VGAVRAAELLSTSRGWADPAAATLSRAAAAAVSLIGVGVLCGWAFEISGLKTWFLGLHPAHPIGALLLIVCSASLFAIAQPRAPWWHVGRVLALFVLLFVAGQSLTGFELGLERLFFTRDIASDAVIGEDPRGRMPTIATVSFLLIAGGSPESKREPYKPRS